MIHFTIICCSCLLSRVEEKCRVWNDNLVAVNKRLSHSPNSATNASNNIATNVQAVGDCDYSVTTQPPSSILNAIDDELQSKLRLECKLNIHNLLEQDLSFKNSEIENDNINEIANSLEKVVNSIDVSNRVSADISDTNSVSSWLKSFREDNSDVLGNISSDDTVRAGATKCSIVEQPSIVKGSSSVYKVVKATSHSLPSIKEAALEMTATCHIDDLLVEMEKKLAQDKEKSLLLENIDVEAIADPHNTFLEVSS